MRPSRIEKRSIMVGHHKTSVSLEAEFWACFREIAHERHMTLSKLMEEIDMTQRGGGLSSAIRLYVLEAIQKKIATAASGERCQPLTRRP